MNNERKQGFQKNKHSKQFTPTNQNRKKKNTKNEKKKILKKLTTGSPMVKVKTIFHTRFAVDAI